jgi:hypothetical protein
MVGKIEMSVTSMFGTDCFAVKYSVVGPESQSLAASSVLKSQGLSRLKCCAMEIKFLLKTQEIYLFLKIFKCP